MGLHTKYSPHHHRGRKSHDTLSGLRRAVLRRDVVDRDHVALWSTQESEGENQFEVLWENGQAGPRALVKESESIHDDAVDIFIIEEPAGIVEDEHVVLETEAGQNEGISITEMPLALQSVVRKEDETLVAEAQPILVRTAKEARIKVGISLGGVFGEDLLPKPFTVERNQPTREVIELRPYYRGNPSAFAVRRGGDVLLPYGDLPITPTRDVWSPQEGTQSSHPMERR